MVTDIISGSVGSFPSHFAVLGTQIYFKANDGSTGYELWAHDPSELTLIPDEPAMIKDIHSGSTNSAPNSLTAVGNTLFFKANDGTNGSELWKSDGTASGTVMVKELL